MKALRHRRDHAADTGASAVEFALVVPLLLLLVFGIIDFGIVFSQQLSLNNAVRQGAREAVAGGNTGQTTCADVVTNVRDASYALAMDTSQIAVTVQTQSAAGVFYPSGSQPCGTTANPTSSTVVCQGSFQPGGNDSIVVTATYVGKYVVPMPIPGFPSSVTLTSQAVYRCEFS